MLKIKDLNRLKVFGYEENETSYIKDFDYNSTIYILKDNRSITFGGESDKILDEIFELTAANLVEQVEINEQEEKQEC